MHGPSYPSPKIEHRKSIILLPDQVITNWQGSTHLTKANIDEIPLKAADVIIIGTGKFTKFFDTHIFENLIAANVGYEIMDTAAACRTYNLLASDNRAVVAALVISE